MKEDVRAVILVLGDLGRSPRMLYHAESLAKDHKMKIEIVGYRGADPPATLLSEPRIHWNFLKEPYRLPSHCPKFLFLLYAPFKVLFQLTVLVWTLLSLPAYRFILVQNPPAIPTLAVVKFVCWLRQCRLVIDWHNFGYSILALNLGPSHVVVKISKWYEKVFGRRADLHLCVTKAMRSFLESEWKIIGPSLVLYDRPPPHFCRLDVTASHELFLKLSDEHPWLLTSKKRRSTMIEETLFTVKSSRGVEWRPSRPLLVVSSSSWTEDEDMTPLLDTIQLCEARASRDPNFPRLVFIVTGKGPLKSAFEKNIEQLELQFIQVETMWLQLEDYPKLLGSADLGISMHDSSSKLDLPMKVVDMFGCGLPVCAIDYPCLTELITPGKTGLTFRTADELFHNIQYLCQTHPTTRIEMQNTIMRQFSKENRWKTNWNETIWPQLQNMVR